MSLLVLAAAWGLLALPAIAQPWLRRLPPTQTVAVATASLMLGFAGLVVGLVATAAPTVLRAAGFAALAGMCERSLGSLAPGGSAVGWAAVVLAAAVILAGVSSAGGTRRTRRRARVEPWLGDHHDRGTFELVIVPASEP